MDLRASIQIRCLDNLKGDGFGFGPNPTKISESRICGFQILPQTMEFGEPRLASSPPLLRQYCLKPPSMRSCFSLSTLLVLLNLFISLFLRYQTCILKILCDLLGLIFCFWNCKKVMLIFHSFQNYVKILIVFFFFFWICLWVCIYY